MFVSMRSGAWAFCNGTTCWEISRNSKNSKLSHNSGFSKMLFKNLYKLALHSFDIVSRTDSNAIVAER